MNAWIRFYSFNWDSSLKLNEDFMTSLLLGLSNKFPFEHVNRQKIANIAEFDMHSLRHRTCISMIKRGFSVDDILSQIGWSTISSFVRYSKLNILDIKEFNSTDDVIEFINNNHA